MQYRMLGKSGLRVSEVGFGGEHLEKMEYAQIKPVIDTVIESGINILDCFMPEPNVRTNIGRALAGRREKVLIQGHIGAGWINGQYGHTRELEPSRFFFNDLMARLQTDYIDIGMFHFVDRHEIWEKMLISDVLKYAQDMKARGTIKAIGMSSHQPEVALKAVKSGMIDVLMFSLNPAFDILPAGTALEEFFKKRELFQKDSLRGIDPVRRELYETCETRGVGITVMKSLAAGTLLKAESSPFGQALSNIQCIHYALTRPGVASVMVGARTPAEVRSAAFYAEASEHEKDYSLILANTPRYAMTGRCMYCNHCLPCPAMIDIALVNKYLDLASGSKVVPETVRQHYLDMANSASDCLECGACEPRCPFKVPVVERMKQAALVFGK